MNTPTIEEFRELSQQLPEKIPYLKMLVLFGSRATGKTHANIVFSAISKSLQQYSLYRQQITAYLDSLEAENG